MGDGHKYITNLARWTNEKNGRKNGDVHDIWTFLVDKRGALKQFNNSERRWSHPS